MALGIDEKGHILVYLIVSLLIMGGLISSGYVITLDMVFGPDSPNHFHSYFYGVDKTGREVGPTPIATLLYSAFIYFSSFLLPLWFVQKILLLSFLLISGVSMHRVVPVKSPYARYFAGLLYMINPFIYIRFLAGHLYLLWGYALLPLAIKSFIDVVREQSRRNIAKAALLFTLVIPQIHFLPMVFGIFILLLLVSVKKENATKLAKVLIFVLLAVALLNLSWISSIVIGKASIEEIISQITPEHLAVFTSRPSFDFNVLFNVAAMYGFWRGGYELPKENIPFWYIFFFFILFLAVHGFLIERAVAREKEQRRQAEALSIVAVISLILATGVTHEHLSKLFLFLYEHVPFFAGFREPQKFVALLAFTYAYFGAIAVNDFAEKIKQNKIYYALVAFALVTPFIYTHTMFLAFNGQLKSVDYPRDWYEIDEFLSKDKEEFTILFLPWHGYMDFKWLKNSDKRIANPASAFFSKPVIRGDTVEAGGIYSQSTYPVSKYIEFLLANREKIKNFGELIAPLNVKYVILAKEADYPLYSFLFNQSDLELIKETENLYLFKNKHKVAKIYAVDGIVYIKGWEDLLQRGEKEDITGRVYIIGKGTGEASASEKQIISYERKNPVKYVLKEKSRKKYVIFATPYSENWMMGDTKPIKNLGIINAYEARGTPLTIENSKYRSYLVGYVISIFSMISLIVIGTWQR
jgi:hypothetical protein